MSFFSAQHLTPNPSTTTSTQITTSQPLTPAIPTVTLRLRATPSERPRIRWAEDVIDNEGLGRKSSKVCCIYHKSHPVGESSSESDSSSSSDSESDSSDVDDAKARMGGQGKGKKEHKHDNVGQDGGCENGNCGQNHEKEENGKKSARRRKGRNAYESVPKRTEGGMGNKTEVVGPS